MKKSNIHFQNWRDFQKREKRQLRWRTRLKMLPRSGFYILGLIFVLTILFFTGHWLSANLPEDHKTGGEGTKEPASAVRGYVSSDLPDLLNRLPARAPLDDYELNIDGQNLKVETSIDQRLTGHINGLLPRSRTVKAAVVVLRADNGQVLALTSYAGDSDNPLENDCLKADFPAASLFKIIASAAAIEARGFTPEQPLTYQGGRYTLYRKQLNRQRSKYDHTVTFRSAFSKSINPVFGQIGIYDLGQEIMTEYGERFLFNYHIPFDLPLSLSFLDVPEDDFGLAEIASGFNKETKISPLHAAMITASIVNRGVMMRPWMVSKITNGSAEMFYQNQIEEVCRPISEETAEQLKILMKETVTSGTCRVSFSGLRQKKPYDSIDFGAKTGTINDASGQYKIDWLTAYAVPEKDGPTLAVAVLTVHGELLGLRAKDMASNIFQYYYRAR